MLSCMKTGHIVTALWAPLPNTLAVALILLVTACDNPGGAKIERTTSIGSPASTLDKVT